MTPPPGDVTAVADGSTLSATVTGLANGTAHTFIAAASNAIGAGDPSTSSNRVTPKTVPFSPTGVTATAGNGDAMVGWAIPASDGGSPITQYTVTSDLDGLTAAAGGSAASTTVTGLANGTAYTFTVTANPGGQIATPASFTLSVVVTGLDNGTIYTFTVTATNAVGTSAPSAASNAVTPPNAPPPRGPGARRRHRKGGCPIGPGDRHVHRQRSG